MEGEKAVEHSQNNVSKYETIKNELLTSLICQNYKFFAQNLLLRDVVCGVTNISGVGVRNRGKKNVVF